MILKQILFLKGGDRHFFAFKMCDVLYHHFNVRQIHRLSIYSPSSVVIGLSNIDHCIESNKICPTLEPEMVISDCVQELPSPPLGPHRPQVPLPRSPWVPLWPPAEAGTRITSLSGLHLQRSTPRKRCTQQCNAGTGLKLEMVYHATTLTGL